jgi:ATP-binding cassette, subfamily C, bacterial CydC
MKRMDHIAFMEDGEIVMEGKHDELLMSSDRYRRLYELDAPFQLKNSHMTEK